MHSFIFQITALPVDESDYISTSDFIDHWFTNSIADYVHDTDRERTIRELRDYLEGRKIAGFQDDGLFRLSPGGKDIYFDEAFLTFTDALRELVKADKQAFIADDQISGQLFRLNESFSNKYTYYVSSDEFGTLITIDEFMRAAETGVPYYIGGVLEYHS